MMKGIMFNEKYGLESATLNGSKTRTSRDELNKKHSEEEWGFINLLNDEDCYYELSFDKVNCFSLNCNDGLFHEFKTKYKIGEIVAVKQAYEDAETGWIRLMMNKSDRYELKKLGIVHNEKGAGLGNKMFVKNSLMPYQIQITDIKLERLQDISDEDCLREGIEEHMKDVQYGYPSKIGYCGQYPFVTPREAFAALIDKISGKGTWNRNEYHVVYYYKLIK